jgi:hypothetical protein
MASAGSTKTDQHRGPDFLRLVVTGRKVFFFVKKKQKTFFCLGAIAWTGT